MEAVLRAIGLMSGTSLDGVDVALLDTDGEGIVARGPYFFRPYGGSEHALLREALAAAAALTDRTARPGILAAAETMVTDAHAVAVEEFLRRHALAAHDIDVIGFHGQTVLHRPKSRLTVQIGDGPALARRLGIAVVHDFRAADVATGGEGAPLVPIYHRALVQALARPQPIAVLNIGGVANVTFIAGNDPPVACDTGPGNALIDDFMRQRAGAPQDANGVTAARGRIDEAAVARVLAHPFFAAPPPKSLDRNDFGEWTAAQASLARLDDADGAATLTAVTAASIAAIVPHLPKPPRAWIVCGGGANNHTLLRMLAQRLAPATVETANDVGWNADAIEAEAFAYLAVRSLRGLPLTFPTTTGVPQPMPGGVLARP
jgi:anhydro-N-acetylmuramic acid kinase